ncbi:putative DDB1- and CUL4-associated factor 10 isoform X1 [Sciurus carolinensis]|uniref:DDB1- and CUL4-associated factor 10 isoform X1 n=1 Tax=Sciurus carolinensis TaxID=30640 RepID=A0AA41SZW4_SCICA|nr:putative DDB1- and CUL4-associated factor 10 isoform X1 [Sciurus carolinensis]
MFPFGPRSPGWDVAAGAEEPAPHGEQAAAARPPSPAALLVPAQPGLTRPFLRQPPGDLAALAFRLCSQSRVR